MPVIIEIKQKANECNVILSVFLSIAYIVYNKAKQ